MAEHEQINMLTPYPLPLQVGGDLWQSTAGRVAVVASHASLRFSFVYVSTSAYQTIAERVPTLYVRDAVAQCTGIYPS